jgi:pSer/pThr/pTyr-binding forkhead associated (FHA) protein
MAELIIKTGKQRRKTIPLSGSDIMIGQDEDCRIRLEANGISQRHCFLKNSPNGWLIEDLGSRHGTFLNGERIEKELLLQSGDVFSIGPVGFQFVEKKTSPKQTTDDEIAGWLMDDDISNPARPGAGDKSDSAGDESGDKKFQSIAEEAADIISRYQKTSDRKQ